MKRPCKEPFNNDSYFHARVVLLMQSWLFVSRVLQEDSSKPRLICQRLINRLLTYWLLILFIINILRGGKYNLGYFFKRRYSWRNCSLTSFHSSYSDAVMYPIWTSMILSELQWRTLSRFTCRHKDSIISPVSERGFVWNEYTNIIRISNSIAHYCLKAMKLLLPASWFNVLVSCRRPDLNSNDKNTIDQESAKIANKYLAIKCKCSLLSNWRGNSLSWCIHLCTSENI